jgi:hypothetical protein
VFKIVRDVQLEGDTLKKLNPPTIASITSSVVTCNLGNYVTVTVTRTADTEMII